MNDKERRALGEKTINDVYAGEVVVPPEGYAFTAMASIECAAQVLEGAVDPGAWTPARAFGVDLAFELPGVTGGEVVAGS